MPAFLIYDVDHVARFLGCSTRRVRTLLQQGRLQGYKDDRHIWRVYFPLIIRPGRRGPDLRGYPMRRLNIDKKSRKPAEKKIDGGTVIDYPEREA